MRPQDIVVLLKILTIEKKDWQFKDLAYSLNISPAEISESLHRSVIAGLLDFTKRKVYAQNLLEFLQHGMNYVFPQVPGSMVNGVPTAHSHPYFKGVIKSELKYVWPSPEGRERGLAIEPLYPSVVSAVKQDEELYKLLAILDIIRVGRVRERNIADKELSEIILNHVQRKQGAN